MVWQKCSAIVARQRGGQCYGGMWRCWILSRTMYLTLELSSPRTPRPHSPAPASVVTNTLAALCPVSQSQSPCHENSTSNAGPGPMSLGAYPHHTHQSGPGQGPWSRCPGQSGWQAAAGSGRQAVGHLPPQRSPVGWKGQEVSGTASQKPACLPSPLPSLRMGRPLTGTRAEPVLAAWCPEDWEDWRALGTEPSLPPPASGTEEVGSPQAAPGGSA